MSQSHPRGLTVRPQENLMIFTLGVLLHLLGWIVGFIWSNPFTRSFNAGEWVGLFLIILGALLVGASLLGLAWNHLP